MYSFSKFAYKNEAVNPLFWYQEPLSEDYQVFLNGQEVPVYTCRISAYPLNRVWPGYQRPVDQTEVASYINLVSDESIELEVRVKRRYDKILIKPYSKQVTYYDSNGTVHLTLKENGYFVLECDSYHHCLYIFNNKPIAAPKRDQVTHYYGSGIHFAGKVTLHSNESVYVDRDALVLGCFYGEKARNIRIFGNGILDDRHEERTGNYCYEPYTNGNLKFYECEDLSIEGIGMMNSAIWCLNLFGCTNVTVDGIRIFGQWRYNTDGIDVVNCRDVWIRNSFIHSFDDTITIKGIDRYCHRDNENIHIENCALWCDWGKCCEIGVETNCRTYRKISFRNCDILRGGKAALDINNGECAEISDILFEDIRVEYNSFDTQEQYQGTGEEATYHRQGEVAIPYLLMINNQSWRTPHCKEIWKLPDPETVDMTGLTPHMIRDVTCRNIQVYYDVGMPLENGKPILPVSIHSAYEDVVYDNIRLEQLSVNGVPFSVEQS